MEKMNLKMKAAPILAMLLLLFVQLRAAENVGQKTNRQAQLRTTQGCAPSSYSAQLDINNVRCLLHNGGDMWWDLTGNPRYEVPKVNDPAQARHSAFAASLWIGGIDGDKNLRVAAQTYRQRGSDFFPGPLTDNGQITPELCADWNKMFKINRSEIDAFRAAYQSSLTNNVALNIASYPAVRDWPAFGYSAAGRLAMAPFVDVDGNPDSYDPENGDYPDIRPIEGGGQPDQAIWWVINDKGDIHTETGSDGIGLEIQVMAFAFTTANAVNDMTFYKYKVINKSGSALNETFMGQWADVDLGNANDDYVGCDTLRGFGYAYNGDADDEGASGYGANPPVFGMDFFQGPLSENGERLGMSKFIYYDNTNGLTGNPEVAAHYYGYLRGFWKDGSQMTFGGNGFHGSTPTSFMFPGDPGACGAGTGWSEKSEGNAVGDRRFVISSGPFTLQNGARNEIITGAVWARSYQNAQLGSLCEAFSADDLAQALFDANFQLLDGPDAPDLAIEEFDQALVLTWDYPSALLSNNFQESYSQVDPVLASQNVADPEFEFQGYMVFQLKDATVSGSQLFDSDKARIVAQCDIKDGVKTIVNRSYSFVNGLPDPLITDRVMVEGADQGIFHSTQVTEDLFAPNADRRLKNYTQYYFAAIAYAWNSIPSDGKYFIQGNKGFENISGMPHKIAFEQEGTIVSTGYGDGIACTQTAAVGNGGLDVILDEATESAILQNGRISQIGYAADGSPIKLTVVNAKDIQKGNYRLEVVTNVPAGPAVPILGLPQGTVTEQPLTEWILYHQGQEIFRNNYIERIDSLGNRSYRPQPLSGVERVIEGHGISIGVGNPSLPYDAEKPHSPVIAARIAYKNPMSAWLSGMADVDREPVADWIMAGIDTFDRGVQFATMRTARIYDPESNFEQLFGGTFAPFCLARSFAEDDLLERIAPGVSVGPGAPVFTMRPDSMVNLNELPDVDIVITSDPSKWSTCVVVETCPSKVAGSGANILAVKWRPGLGPDLKPLGTTPTIANQGWSVFPGYAIDVNTGQRLNIFFGENSWDRSNNGDDLLFNPTDQFGPGGKAAGGRHYIYVSCTPYDGCAQIHQMLALGTMTGVGTQLTMNPSLTTDVWTNPTHLGRVYKDVAWVGVPMSQAGYKWKNYNEIPSDVKLSLRVDHPFHSRTSTNDYPIFEFNTDAIAAQTGVVAEAKKSLMECVRVVPNPYYAFSKYERSQLQTIVKITNLPQKAKIKIFNLSGTLVRSYDKDSDAPDQAWDLKNSSGTPVAGGVYLIHVDGFDLGETIVKAMIIMPQIDLNSF